MPKFVGRNARPESKQIQDDAPPVPGKRVCLSYSQQKLLPAYLVTYSLNTSDRGCRNSYAKRWYNWFAHPCVVLCCVSSTPAMKRRAEQSIAKRERMTSE
jgi:hypothetical protein